MKKDSAWKKYAKQVCEKHGIEMPNSDKPWEIEPVIVKELQDRGLDDYEIRQEFLSDWEVYLL